MEPTTQERAGVVAVLGDIQKFIKVAQILETVGEAVVQNVENNIIPTPVPAATPVDSVRSAAKGIHFLHTALSPSSPVIEDETDSKKEN